MIAEHSEGVPRNINNLCFNAMSLGCALNRRMIDREIVREVIADLDLESLQERTSLAWRPEEDGEQASPRICLRYELSIDANGLAPEIHRSLRNPARPWRGALPRPSLDDGEDCRACESCTPTTHPCTLIFLQPAQHPQRATQANIIRVTAGQSLYQICIKNFGCYNSERVQEIQKLNPRLRNLDHIESGQKLRIPVVEKLSSPTQRDIAQSGNALLAERSRQ